MAQPAREPSVEFSTEAIKDEPKKMTESETRLDQSESDKVTEPDVKEDTSETNEVPIAQYDAAAGGDDGEEPTKASENLKSAADQQDAASTSLDLGSDETAADAAAVGAGEETTTTELETESSMAESSDKTDVALLQKGHPVPEASQEIDLEKGAVAPRKKGCIGIGYIILFLLAVGGITAFALWRAGYLSAKSEGLDAQPPMKGPDVIDVPKPTAQLIIDKNIAPGPFGCSNYPIRAPLKSTDYANQFSASNASSDPGTTFMSVPALACSEKAVRYSLTECDLLRAMTANEDSADIPSGLPDGSAYLDDIIRKYLPHLLIAIEAFDLNCSPERLANFLAQIRHETDRLKVMYQSIDGGSGAVHMIPRNFPKILAQVRPVRKAFNEEFGKDSDSALIRVNEVSKKDKGTWNEEESSLMARVARLLGADSITFLVGAWWFVFGSKQILGDLGCNDLRLESDVGMGNRNGTQTGFYAVTKCIFGSAEDAGISQRIGYFEDIYDGATSYWKCQTKECAR